MTTTIKTINDYNFFDLVSLSYLDPEEKESIVNKMSEIIWKEFLIKELEEMLKDEDTETINQIIEQKRDNKKLFQFILNKYPQVKAILLKITARVKKDMILGLLDNLLDGYTRRLKYVKEGSKRESVQGELDRYIKARKLTEEENWQQFHKLMCG